MRSRRRVANLTYAFLALAALGGSAVGSEPNPKILRICADPDSLPFSNERGEGFEDKIAALIRDDLHARLQMTWRLSKRGFLRRGLQSGACDVVMAVPPGLPGVATTKPYYRTYYVVISAKAENLELASYDDPRLATLKIGLPALGAEGANIPPAEALARRGLVGNIVGFPVYSDGKTPDPQARMIDAVATGEIDAAFVWGPIGGYFAQARNNQLVVARAPDDPRQPDLAFAYNMMMGVRRDEPELRDALNDALDRRKIEISAILKSYGVPLADIP